MARLQGGPYADGSVDIRVGGRYAQMMLPEDHEDYLGPEDLDLEELASGRLKDKNGKFSGRPPKFLPRQIVDAMRSEHYKRVNGLLEESLSDQVKTMIEISSDIDVDPSTRLKAAIYVYERFMGRTPDRPAVTAESTVDDLVDDILFDVEEQRLSAVEKEIAAAEGEIDNAKSSRRDSAARVQHRARIRAQRRS